MTEVPDLKAFNAGIVEEFRANGGNVEAANVFAAYQAKTLLFELTRA